MLLLGRLFCFFLRYDVTSLMLNQTDCFGFFKEQYNAYQTDCFVCFEGMSLFKTDFLFVFKV